MSKVKQVRGQWLKWMKKEISGGRVWGFNTKNSVNIKHELARSVLDRSRSISSYFVKAVNMVLVFNSLYASSV